MTKLTFLGTGTSQGVPIVGCQCPVCRSEDPRDKRYRSSVLVAYDGLDLLIDAGPDFRSQMLRAGVRGVDAILVTHNHKDHTGGLDDVRAFNYICRQVVDIYCEERVLRTLKNDYAYAFSEHKYPGSPEWRIHLIDDKPFRIDKHSAQGELDWVHDKGYFLRQADGSLVPTGSDLVEPAPKERPNIVPIRGMHGEMPVLGFRFGKIAYITDVNYLPESSLELLHGLEHVTLNTVGYKPHHSHYSLDEALAMAQRIGARHTWLTHLSHAFPRHRDFCTEIKERCKQLNITVDVQPAYDGLVIEA